ncbi:hypothetical protein DP804_23350 [Salmonella enterica subsp. enterica]|nr:hypothetical protein [Salmonella enterica subsp. enterica serovar Virchow]
MAEYCWTATGFRMFKLAMIVLTYNSRNQLMSLGDEPGQQLGFFHYDANGQQNVTDAEAVMLYYQSGGTLLDEMQGTMSST